MELMRNKYQNLRISNLSSAPVYVLNPQTSNTISLASSYKL